MPALWVLTLAASAELMVADFNSGTKPNNLGDIRCTKRDQH